MATRNSNRMNRCFLKALIGDGINAVLAATASNLQKLLRGMACALYFWQWRRLKALISSEINRSPFCVATI